MKISTSSKKQITFILSLFIIPFIAFLTLYNIYINHVFNSKIAQNNQTKINLMKESMEKELKRVEYFMANLAANDAYFGQLKYKLSKLNAHLYTYNILEKYNDILNTTNYVGGMFIFTINNALYRSTYRSGLDMQQRDAIKSYLMDLTASETDISARDWFLEKIDNDYYLFYIIEMNETYVISMVSLNNSSVTENYDKDEPDGYIIYSKEDGTALSFHDRISEKNVTLEKGNKVYYITGEPQKYFIVQTHSDYMGLNMVYITPYHGVLALEPSQVILLLGTIFFIILSSICYLLLKHYFFKPLSYIVDTMNSVKDGDMTVKMRLDSKSEEFRLVNDTFNEMIDRIKKLKILAYEQTLITQQTKLEYLQLQIRPHFYLNCLKNLYGLAEEKKYHQIQESILSLSDYLRSMFHDISATIPIDKELASVEAFLRLKQMGGPNSPAYAIDRNEQAGDFGIPPHSILTFVENSVKYGMSDKKQLKIFIKVGLLINEESQYINIMILDNGPGFNEDTLSWLNGEDRAISGKHIGINNVKQRYKLMFDNKCSFTFSNRNGACVDIFIPYDKDCQDNNQR
jgi:two-component system sensor histidine kinase YesM